MPWLEPQDVAKNQFLELAGRGGTRGHQECDFWPWELTLALLEIIVNELYEMSLKIVAI